MSEFAPLVEEIFVLQSFYNDNERRAVGETFTLQSKVIHFLANTVWDDLMEILLLFANNYPLGARKILRAMFESTVHLLWFVRNPSDIEKFVEFTWVDEGKLVNVDSSYYDSGDAKEILSRAAKASEMFQIPVCERCKVDECLDCAKTRTAGSWLGKTNIVTLAKTVGLPSDMIRMAYYLPLHETHPKFQAIMLRQKNWEDGTAGYYHSLDSDPNDRTLMSAHYMCVVSLTYFMEFFEVPDVGEQVLEMGKRFGTIWSTIYRHPNIP